SGPSAKRTRPADAAARRRRRRSTSTRERKTMARTSTSNGHGRSETRRTTGPKTLAEKVGLPSAGQPEGPWDHGETRPDGRPWWRHSLFPLELTAPDTVARWFLLDQKCE